MWTVIKYHPNSLVLLKNNLKKKLGKNCKIYIPQIEIKKKKGVKFFDSKINILGDYLFCFHESFNSKNSILNIKFLKGLKYVLEGYLKSQNDISEFIDLCKNSENSETTLAASTTLNTEKIK